MIIFGPLRQRPFTERPACGDPVQNLHPLRAGLLHDAGNAVIHQRFGGVHEIVEAEAVIVGVDKTGALSDFHPIAGIIDSSLTVEEKYYFRAMIGYTFWRAQQTEVDVVGGIQGTRVEATLRTDETGGGGVNNRFTESEMMYSPVLGAQARHNMPNTFNMFLYAGLYATHMDDLDITGTSAVNNFDYNARLGGGWQYEGRFGVGFPF